MVNWALESISREDLAKNVQESMDHYGIDLDSWSADKFIELDLFFHCERHLF